MPGLPGILLLLPSILHAAAASYTLPLPGTLIDAAGVTLPGGRSGAALLVAAGKDGRGAKTLFFLDPDRRAPERLAALHEEVNALTAFDLAGNGAPAAIAGMPGVLFTPSGGGGMRKVLEEPHVDLRSIQREGRTPRPWIPAARAGLLELFGLSPGGELTRHASFTLPMRTERMRWGLQMESPPVSLLAGEPPLFAAGPEVLGRRRLKTLLIPAAGGDMTEAWSLLPGDERLNSGWRYLRLDGNPLLAVTTFESLGLTAKKRLRLFELGRDRSRQGSAPILAFETPCPLWYALDVAAEDADADGHQDLVLVHPTGLRGKELHVSAWRGLGNGRFDPKPRHWMINSQPTDWLYGPDLTSDRIPDLLVLTGGRLLLYAGDPKGPRPLASKPVWGVTVTGAPKDDQKGEDEPDFDDEDSIRDLERFLTVIDLPGGGKLVMARGAQKDGKSVLTVVRR